MEIASALQWPDYLILASFLAISLGIGLYHALTGGRQKTTSEFIMANRSLKILPTAISLLVSYQSAILILGLAAEMYWFGAQLLLLSPLCYMLSTIITVTIFVPWMFPLKLTSVYEYLDLRFHSKGLRMFGATLGILSEVLYMGVAMYAPSAALESATGLPLRVSIPLMAIVTITYTALGGMRAVIWTDVFQFLTMVGGMIAILIKGLVVVGGFGQLFERIGQEGRLQWVDWNPDPRVRHNFVGFMIGATVTCTQTYGLAQSSIQRFSATKDLPSARITMILQLPGSIIMDCIACIVGLTLCAYYASIRCDPLANGQITNFNQLLPDFVMTTFSSSPGFAGLFLAVLYGGALSSVSSSLSGSAANCWEDILKWKLAHLKESTKALINRFLVIVFGFIATAMSFLAATIPGPVTQIVWALGGSVTGPLLGVFLLGGISRHANAKGALFGGVFGLAVNFWLSFGAMLYGKDYPTLPPVPVDGCTVNNVTVNHVNNNITRDDARVIYLPDDEAFLDTLQGMENVYAISYIWYSVIGVTLTLMIGSLASLVFRNKEEEENLEDRFLICFRKYLHEFTFRMDSVKEEPMEMNHLKEADVFLLKDIPLNSEEPTRRHVIPPNSGEPS